MFVPNFYQLDTVVSQIHSKTAWLSSLHISPLKTINVLDEDGAE